MPRRAIIIGGSLGGLFAAAALRSAGWDICVYERAATELSGRGAGIVTHPELMEILTAVGASTDELGVPVEERVAFDLDGKRVRTISHRQIVTSWDRIHQLLRPLVPESSHRLGRTLESYSDFGDSVRVNFDTGEQDEADMLIGADGFRSAVRAQMLPHIRPEFSGYVVWRAVIDEDQIEPAIHRAIFGAFGFFLPTGRQVIGYPIAGPGNDLRRGKRRYNFVWYEPVSDSELCDLLTDSTGRIHPISIPPPLVRDDVLRRMMTKAEGSLPTPFVNILKQSERPFVAPIYDHHAPAFAQGRVAMVGDAACVARPHVGMGVTKAALDALSLTTKLSETDPIAALKVYSAERVPAARTAFERARSLGDSIFAAPNSGANKDGRSHPKIEAIMHDTAIAHL